MAYELYRGARIGVALDDALAALLARGDMTPALAQRLLAVYDRVVARTLDNPHLATRAAVRVRVRRVAAAATLA
jgi:hypothetical protein